jgi:hypothetical protein
MKTKLVIAAVLSLCVSHVILAEDSCIVIGYHEPNSQVYDGPTFCTNVTIKNINVRGPLQVNHCNMTGLTKVSGPLNAANTQFDHIKIKSHFSSMTVVLKNQSIDHGGLLFQGSSGYYHLDSTSKIIGHVVNGSPASAVKK